MLVEMIHDRVRAVVVKLNPKRARVRTIDAAEGHDAGTIWNCPYGMLNPVVGEHTTVMMKSFEQPDNDGIKVFMKKEQRADEPVGELDRTDEMILRAICEIYARIDDTTRNERYHLSSKINTLFTAFGREVSKDAAEEWLQNKSAADS
jgi:hypothetical protein